MAEGFMNNRANIQDVMSSCGCSEAEAINLLQHSDNDPERAKRRHRTQLRFTNLRTGGHSPSPSIEKRLPRQAQSPHSSNNQFDHSSDDDNRFNTPRTEDTSFSAFTRTSRNGSDHSDRPLDLVGDSPQAYREMSRFSSRQLPVHSSHEPYHESPRKLSRESLTHPRRTSPLYPSEEAPSSGYFGSPRSKPTPATKVPPRIPPRPIQREKPKSDSRLSPDGCVDDGSEALQRIVLPESPTVFYKGHTKRPSVPYPEEFYNEPTRVSAVPSRQESLEDLPRRCPESSSDTPRAASSNESEQAPAPSPPSGSTESPEVYGERPKPNLGTANQESSPQAPLDTSQPSYPDVPPVTGIPSPHEADSESISSPVSIKAKPMIVVEPAPPEPDDLDVHDLKNDIVDGFHVKPEWDFRLPLIPAPSMLTPGQGQGTDGFNLLDLIGAIQHGATDQMIASYFGYYSPNTIRRHINDEVDGFPAIFFAAASNNDLILRRWISHGGDVNAVHKAYRVPLLAFAIIHSDTLQTETTHIVATLLSLGASPSVLPTAFYSPYCKDIPDDGPEDDDLGPLDADTSEWLTKTARCRLARTINLTHRYNLERAGKTKKPSMRHRQVALLKNAEALLGLPYFLIGQSMAANRLLQTCLSHLVIPGRRPLVMAFAGPSGHGKTELARRLGYLMGLEIEVVDCTIVNREIELFGGRHPYVNADQGTPLNNFLARNSGKRCIVFLDEFEKTTREIHQALLLPFDNGEYQDRRNVAKIDCSKTIWILATNALDATIQNFCKLNEQVIFNDEDESRKLRLLKGLEKSLKDEFVTKFDAPITGRISAFLPFLLFSPQEQAVIAHKYLLELGNSVRSPVSLHPGAEERLIGNIRLRVRRDASVCRAIADEGYHVDLGARSLIAAVDSVKSLLVDSYLAVDELITERNGDGKDGLVDFLVDVSQGEVVTSMDMRGKRREEDKEVNGAEGDRGEESE